jgi:predicted alpha-1,2-mannosidase
MIGSNSAAIIADAVIQGVKGFDVETLYEALLKNTQNEGPISSVGRKGVAYYNTLGFVPYNVGINENVARTLEYAYADFCMYTLAKKLQKPDTTIFKQRLLNYKNVFDSSHLLMRGKNMDGSFQTPYNPFKWGDAFTEGNAWHYSWSVFQDINGLQNLMGGANKMEQMLDSLFALPPIFDDSYYGHTIHEIKEMQIINMGQYAHGNQPIQHVPYLYMYCNNPAKTQYWVQQIMQRLYKPTPDGYCGDEDNGQTSAWYVMSALGFYSVTPASNQFVLGVPLFEKATLTFNNKQTTILKKGSHKGANYVQQILLNNALYTKAFINGNTLKSGTTIQFFVAPTKPKVNQYKHFELPFSFSTKQ